MIWGYDGRYPIAEVENASESDVIHLNFESESTLVGFPSHAVQTESYTGEKCMSLYSGSSSYFNFTSSDKIDVQNQNGKYTLSAWVKTPNNNQYNITNSNLVISVWDETGTNQIGWHNAPIGNTQDKWKYFEVIVDLSNYSGHVKLLPHIWNNAQFPTPEKIYFDDIRFHPTDASMVTYTFSPLGMTSKIDNRQKKLTYEYDEFGRLIVVRDDEMNIISQNKYNYRP